MCGSSSSRRVVDIRMTTYGGLGGRSAGIGAQPLQQGDQVVVGGQIGAGQVSGQGRVVSEDDLGRRRLQLRVVSRPPRQQRPREYGHPFFLVVVPYC